jgi:AraC-like DNA-binding protein
MQDRYAVNPGWGLILADIGVNPADVLKRAVLPADLLRRTNAHLSNGEIHALWSALEAEVGEQDLPLLLGRAISMESFDPAIFAATCSPNLQVAARRIADHKKLIAPMRVEVIDLPLAMEVRLVWPETLPPPRAMAMTDLVFWVALARLATRHDVRPLAMTAPTIQGDDMAAYREYLGIEPTWSPHHAVTFSSADARRPFLTANEPMWNFFEPELRRRLSEVDAASSMRHRVQSVLLETLPAGDGSMPRVARDLAVSTRTLQRRLREEGASFQEVLNATRERLARHYLTRSELPASEISFLLGYGDPRSFYRAFQAWTGTTPRVVRATG